MAYNGISSALLTTITDTHWHTRYRLDDHDHFSQHNSHHVDHDISNRFALLTNGCLADDR